MDISLLVCTYNRCNELEDLLETVVAQDTGGTFTYEVIVVDNNSTDRTRDVVHRFIDSGHTHIRYFFEPRQGRSNALNTGLEAVRGAYYAIADDDLLLPPNYLATIVDSFRRHPEISFLGGKVLPRWSGPVPAWLTQEHWSALALCDYGEVEFVVDESRQLTLLAGAFRTAEVKRVNGYHPELGVSPKRIGGTEDVDLYTKLFNAGERGLYVPSLSLLHKVEPERLSKRYHRRWHTEHGRTYAIMSAGASQRARFTLFGTPSYMLRDAIVGFASWCSTLLRGRVDEAFEHECLLRFSWGYIAERSGR